MPRRLTYLTLTVVIAAEPHGGHAQNISANTSWQDQVLSGVASGNNFGAVTQNFYGIAPPDLSFTATGGAISGSGDPGFDYGSVNIRAGLYQQTEGAFGADGTDGNSPVAGTSGGQVTTTLTGFSISLDFNNITVGIPPVLGLGAFSYGGNGGSSGDDDQNAGSGGAGWAVNVSLTSNVSANFASAATGNGAVGIRQSGGSGGSARSKDDSSRGGNGGRTDAMVLSVQDSTITATSRASTRGRLAVAGVIPTATSSRVATVAVPVG